MNILQVLPELKSGGVERGTVDLAKFLQKHGHGSIVVSAGGPLVGELASAGVKHFTLPVHRKSPLSVWRCVRALTRIVREERVDLIHARSRVPALVAYFTGRRAQVPLVTTCHGFYSRHPFSHVMGWGNLIIVASHVIGKRMRDDFGVAYDRMRLIPRGVNLEEFKPRALSRPGPSEAPVVGMVGRITAIKGHPLFLKAMARVARVRPDVRIQIIGDAPKPQYKEELRDLTRRLGLQPQVEFLGTRYDIPELLSKMTVLAVPSVGEEAFGRVAIEAGAIGVPVVATRIGGLVDVIEDGRTGLQVPVDDPIALADAVLKLINDPVLAARLSQALREKVQQDFSLEQMFARTLAVYEEVLARRRVLVIKLSALGDVILSIPSLRALRRAWPKAWIAVLTRSRSREILRHCPYVNDVIVLNDAPGARSGLRRLLRAGRMLANQNFDTVVDLQNNRISRWLGWLSGARLRAGHARGRHAGLLNRKAASVPMAAIGPVEHQFNVLRALGLSPQDTHLEIWSGPSDTSSVDGFLAGQWVSPSQALVGINPGSSPRWPTKQWGVENFARLCDELAKRNIRVVVTGSDYDRPLAERLVSLTRNKPINAAGRTSITELASLIRRCRVFVSSDSAPMHVASACDVPLVALFGPTDPKRHLLPPSQSQVFWKEIACSPCYLRNCPIGHTCMKKIGVPEVLEAVLRLVKQRRDSSENAAVQAATR